jgi:hypothetical protein
LPAVLGNLTNKERESQNLSVLSINPILNKAAEMKAQDMASKGYFAHTSPEGKTPWYWIEFVGYKYQYAGENLAVNFYDSKDVTTAWLNSPTHKANIVKENYTEMGTGVATGIYMGQESIFVAQIYANPMQVAVASKAPEVKVDSTTETKQESENILGAEVNINPVKIVTDIEQKPAFWQKLLSSPRNTTNVLLSIIFGIIAIALILYIVIKMRDHHRDLITNGLAVLAVIGAIFIANYNYSYKSMTITQSLDYSVNNR